MGIVPGRMERIDLGKDFSRNCDFAHTPNAIQQALLAARELRMEKRLQYLSPPDCVMLKA